MYFYALFYRLVFLHLFSNYKTVKTLYNKHPEIAMVDLLGHHGFPPFVQTRVVVG